MNVDLYSPTKIYTQHSTTVVKLFMASCGFVGVSQQSHRRDRIIGVSGIRSSFMIASTRTQFDAIRAFDGYLVSTAS